MEVHFGLVCALRNKDRAPYLIIFIAWRDASLETNFSNIFSDYLRLHSIRIRKKYRPFFEGLSISASLTDPMAHSLSMQHGTTLRNVDITDMAINTSIP